MMPYRGLSTLLKKHPISALALAGIALGVFASGCADSYAAYPEKPISHIKAGKIRPLATSSPRRLNVLPDVPAVAESYPGFDLVPWFAIWAPAKTPQDIVRKLNQEINAILKMPDVGERFSGSGAEVMGGSVEAFVKFHRAEFERWTNFIKAAGIRMD